MRRFFLLVAILASLPLGTGITIARGADAGGTGESLAGAPDTATLEIVCSGLRNGDIEVFDVYDPEGRKTYTVALRGTGPGKAVRRRITALMPGLYRVESANWAWAYEKSPRALEMRLSAGDTTSFNFSESKRSGIPLNYENGKLNVFKTQ